MHCPGNNVVQIMPGYWRASTRTDAVLSCLTSPSTAACSGSLNSTAAADSAGSALCAVGYTGVLCNVCAVGWAKLGTTTCERCPPPALNKFIMFVLLAALCFFSYIVVIFAEAQKAISFSLSLLSFFLRETCGKLTMSLWQEDETVKAASSSAERAENMREVLSRATLGAVIKVTLNFAQCLFYLGRLSANWGSIAQRFLTSHSHPLLSSHTMQLIRIHTYTHGQCPRTDHGRVAKHLHHPLCCKLLLLPAPKHHVYHRYSHLAHTHTHTHTFCKGTSCL